MMPCSPLKPCICIVAVACWAFWAACWLIRSSPAESARGSVIPWEAICARNCESSDCLPWLIASTWLVSIAPNGVPAMENGLPLDGDVVESCVLPGCVMLLEAVIGTMALLCGAPLIGFTGG